MRRRPSHRGQAPAPRARRRRRLGTFFFILGILTVLGGTFAVGALAGRFSLRPASVASAKTVERPKPAAPPQPELTFYRELTAPLTTPPPPPKPAAATKPPAKREPAPSAPAASERPELPARHAPDIGSTVAAARSDGARYTVQVGAFSAREQAESMGARLLAAGHPAYVTENDTPGGAKYRVRIGIFANAEDARQTAQRVAAEARVATYGTTR
jgi:cell division protein FtsN